MALRPASRSARTNRTAESRTPVRDFARGAEATVEWDVRPAYDFIFSLASSVGTTDDLPREDRTWLEESKASLPADIRTILERACRLDTSMFLAGTLIRHPELRSAADVVAHVTRLSPRELIGVVSEEATCMYPGLLPAMERALAGDASAVADVAAGLEAVGKSGEACDVLVEMLRSPDSAAGEIVALMTAWAGPFRTVEARVAGIIERDFALRAADRNTQTASDLIERTTGGVRWLPEPGVRRVILAPSYFSRPYNFVLAGTDWRFFGYPVSDDALEALGAMAIPPSVVRLHRALGDESRLRILRLLADRDLYLTEIAGLLDLSKPTIKHHLTQLRVAGLVTVIEQGVLTYYSLRRERLDDVSTELKRFLVG